MIEALRCELGGQGAVSIWRAALFAVPTMGAPRGTRPFLADRPSHPSTLPGFGIPIAARSASAKRSIFPSRTDAPSPCESVLGTLVFENLSGRGVFDAGYDVAACAGSPARARPAPIAWAPDAARAERVRSARTHAYGPEQANFFMRAFLRGQGGG